METPDTSGDETINIPAFRAIKEFVIELKSLFPTETKTPLSLYFRLIQHIDETRPVGMKKAITGFELFCKEWSTNLESLEGLRRIPSGGYRVSAGYGESKNVFINIGYYVKKLSNDEENLEIIRQHLSIISALLIESEPVGIPEINPGLSAVGSPLKKIIDRFMTKVKNFEGDNAQDVLMEIMSSGMFAELMQELQKMVSSGNISSEQLMPELMEIFSTVIPRNTLSTLMQGLGMGASINSISNTCVGTPTIAPDLSGNTTPCEDDVD